MLRSLSASLLLTSPPPAKDAVQDEWESTFAARLWVASERAKEPTRSLQRRNSWLTGRAGRVQLRAIHGEQPPEAVREEEEEEDDDTHSLSPSSRTTSCSSECAPRASAAPRDEPCKLMIVCIGSDGIALRDSDTAELIRGFEIDEVAAWKCPDPNSFLLYVLPAGRSDVRGLRFATPRSAEMAAACVRMCPSRDGPSMAGGASSSTASTPVQVATV